MDAELRNEADARFEAALEESGARDPREHYRALLRGLKGGDAGDAGAYDEAVRHYDDVVIPGIASGELEPLAAWREFGRKLAELTATGRTVEIDATGRAHPYDPSKERDNDDPGAAGEDPEDRERLVLHLPDRGSEKAILICLPSDVSRAQRATYDLLVAGKQTLGG